MYSPETVSRIETLRAIAATRKLTMEENVEVMRLIRGDRIGASYASSGAKAKKAAAQPVDGEALLAKLMEM